MNITIIGTGNMAKGIGTRLAKGGHSVSIHTRDKTKGLALAEELKRHTKNGAEIDVAEIGSQVEDIIILAVPYGEIAKLSEQYDGWANKVVVDITNPIDFASFQLIPAAGTSGAEELATLLPKTKLVKAFNTTFAGTLIEGKVDGKPLDVFIAGENKDAKDKVSKLAKDGGLRPVDVGPLSNSRHLEGFALLHMSVQEQLGTNWMSSLKILG